ncbi:MAG: hypothetical protein NTZ18_04745 [Candidatus Komeilibacteria bacterium]|nr:hypothetical protein [Candidatus Komeilibacteria bacterium]
MLNSKEIKLNNILHYGLVEIRILASRKREDKRIFQLANILHNLPNGIRDIDNFNFNRLELNLRHYQKLYKDDCIDFIKLLNE